MAKISKSLSICKKDRKSQIFAVICQVFVQIDLKTPLLLDQSQAQNKIKLKRVTKF